MKRTTRISLATVTAAVAIFGAAAFSASQDKYTLKSPGGIAFADFKGYEDWADTCKPGAERCEAYS